MDGLLNGRPSRNFFKTRWIEVVMFVLLFCWYLKQSTWTWLWNVETWWLEKPKNSLLSIFLLPLNPPCMSKSTIYPLLGLPHSLYFQLSTLTSILFEKSYEFNLGFVWIGFNSSHLSLSLQTTTTKDNAITISLLEGIEISKMHVLALHGVDSHPLPQYP